jgi:hypothetical protein
MAKQTRLNIPYWLKNEYLVERAGNYRWERRPNTLVVGMQGVEPRLPESESGVLPLDDIPASGGKVYQRGT